MEDGLLYLASRVYEASADAIRAETEKLIATAANYPDLGSSVTEEFVEGEIELDELRHFWGSFGVVVDVVEGVDRLFEYSGDDTLYEELPF